jgi:alpha-L-fucosidase 2
MMNRNRLWYRQPAQAWVEALPIGNGRTGGMVFGHITAEKIALNDDTFWSGAPRDGNHPDHQAHLAHIRTLLSNGEYRAAEIYTETHMIESWTQSYLPLGDLVITHHHDDSANDYMRELDLTTATSTTHYINNGVRYQRRAYVSAPDQALFVELNADQYGKLTFSVALQSHYTTATQVVAGRLLLTNAAPLHVEPSYVNDPQPERGLGQGMRGAILVAIAQHDGVVSDDGHTLTLRDATHATLVVTTATSFERFDQPATADAVARVQQTMDVACAQHHHWERHVADHQTLFQRMTLDLGNSRDDLPTDVRLQRLHSQSDTLVDETLRYHAHDAQLAPVEVPTDDLGLLALLLQMGRYLIIAGSRPGTQATNLQGIWNDNRRPAWSSNYTININTQMNYWAVQTTNLAECQGPLHDLVANLMVDGQRVAASYGCRGWTSHHNTDIWAPANPVKGRALWFMWPFSAAWLSTHLWEHVQFGGDRDFARQQALPALRGAAEFCLDWLQPQPDGTLGTNPSTSPENVFIVPADGQPCGLTISSESDMAMIRHLFDACIKLATMLGEQDAAWVNAIHQALPLLPAPLIDSAGRLKEWRHDLPEAELGHRHISHLYGIYPGDQITPAGTPQLAEAVRASLATRLAHGGGHTGWSAAWVAACYARLHDGDTTVAVLYRLLRDSTYPSLLGAHPPFQIDGSYGAPAAIAELLLQSHTDAIDLLPALPAMWADGRVHGLCARGGVVVDMTWQAGALTQATITARRATTITIRSHTALRTANQATSCNTSGWNVTLNAGESVILHP